MSKFKVKGQGQRSPKFNHFYMWSSPRCVILTRYVNFWWVIFSVCLFGRWDTQTNQLKNVANRRKTIPSMAVWHSDNKHTCYWAD